MKTTYRTTMIGLLFGTLLSLGCATQTDESTGAAPVEPGVMAPDDTTAPPVQVPTFPGKLLGDDAPPATAAAPTVPELAEGVIDVPVVAEAGSPIVDPATVCGDLGQYINTPMVVNDGSEKYVPAGGVVPAGSGVEQPILLEVGSTLTSITVRIAPVKHTSLSDMLVPYLELRKVDKNGKKTKVGELAWDPYGTPLSTANDAPGAADGFSQVHEITMPLSEVVDDQYYYLTFAQEWGGGQAHDGVVCGTMLTATSANQ